MTWPEWVQLHLRVFGMQTPGEAEMVADWADIFRDAGFSPDELAAATRWLAGNDPPRWRADALHRLGARVREARAEAERQRQAAEPVATGCRLCGGCGWVAVPDPAAYKAGKYAEHLACCTCPLGRWRVREGDSRPSVEHWFTHWPGWRDVMAEHARACAARLVAGERAGQLDRALGAVFARLQGRLADADGAQGDEPEGGF